jgi:glutathione-regulated potassium-efflux system ancillary protein KefC
MDYIWILIAFGFGFIFKQFGLPPLVGYLLAGFSLHAMGFESHDGLQLLADLGITLMLFTIGLKLNISSLVKPEILVTAVTHSLAWCGILVLKWLLLGVIGFGLVGALDMSWQTALLVAFALSFSSTIGVIKLLEDQDELKTRHGKVAIGILVIQDIIAVVFLAFATGEVPSLWALSLLLFIPLKPALNMLMQRVGHGELLPLLGFFLALGGSELFYAVNLKGDLGALFMGALLASAPKSAELYKSLMGFKDLFLIGFFLLVGFTAAPTVDMFVIAAFISLLLVVKFALFLMLFLFFHMRPRNAFLCAITLSNFSEFGLIVANMAVSENMLSNEWLVIIALSVTFSLIISSGVFKYSHTIYARHKSLINWFQYRKNTREFVLAQPEAASIIVIGMGRVGTAAYDSLAQSHNGEVLGIDADEERVLRYQQTGRQVLLGDGEDADFWSEFNLDKIDLVMLSTPGIIEMKFIIGQIREQNYSGKIACIARFEDECQQLLANGADVVFNYFSEVGTGFAEEGRKLLQSTKPSASL